MSVQSVQAKRIFLEALEIDAPTARAVFLGKACAGDLVLRQRVEALIAAHQNNDGLLDRPAVDVTEFAADDFEPLIALAEPAGTVIGPYTLIEPIGEGGMGIVYMAEQTRPVRRKVALKVVKPGMDTRQVVARFEAERQALALMDHPHIARVLDAGATAKGRPYFVMELVRGIPITEFCDREQLDVPARLRLFALVCQAVQHAHQKGVIHRDLKPSNILVTVIDGQAVPKIIDFGVAKAMSGRLTERTLHTGFHQFVGTPLYMSPEQAALSGADADTRGDVYSLGVLLYELLVGSTPIDRDTVRESSHEEVRRIIREVDPPKPSTRLGASGARLATIAADRLALPRALRRSIRGELDWVVMKALEKDRGRRYQTAWALAADVTRFLEGRPLEAGPPSARYRFKKYARRNKTLLTTTALVAGALIAGTAISTWQAVRATRAEGRMAAALATVEQHRRLAERHLRNSMLQQAAQAVELGQVERAQEILSDEQFIPSAPDFAWGALYRLARREIARIADPAGTTGWYTLAPDGRQLAYVTRNNEVVLWDTAAERPVRRLATRARLIRNLAYAPDGSRLASAGGVDDGKPTEARVWDLTSGRLLTRVDIATPGRFPNTSFAGRDLVGVLLSADVQEQAETAILDLRPASEHGPVQESPSVRRIQGDRFVLTADGQAVGFFTPGRLSRRALTGDTEIWSIPARARQGPRPALSPEGRFLTAVDREGEVVVLGAADGREHAPARLRSKPPEIRSLLVGPEARHVIVVDDVGALIWDRRADRSHRIPLTKTGRKTERFRAALSPDGRRLALGAWGVPGGQEPIKIHDVADGRVVAAYPGRLGQVAQPIFADDGRSIFLDSGDSIIRWYFEPSRDDRQPRGHAEEAWTVAFSPDGKTLASGGDNTRPGETITIWDAASGARLNGWRVPRAGISSLAFSPDGKTLASAELHPSGNVFLWDVATGKRIATLEGHTDRVRSVAFSPDGATLASAGSDRTIRLWEASTGEPIATLSGHADTIRAVTFSPDGATLASASNDDSTRLWSVPNGELVQVFPALNPVVAVAFSPDGLSLMAAEQKGGVTIWNLKTGARRLAIHGRDDELLCMALSPDGQTIATAGLGRSVRLWDPLTGQGLLSLDGHQAQVNGLAFSPDGDTLASCSHDGAVKLWRSTEP